MGWRLLIGPILIAVLALIFVADAWTGRPAILLFVLALCLGARSAWELTRLMRGRAFAVQGWLVMLCSLLVIAANWGERLTATTDLHVRSVSALGPTMLVLALSLMGLLWSEAIRYRRPGQSMESLGAELFIVCYVGVLLSLTTQLRWVAGSDAGYVALGSLVMAAKSGDIGAYFLGKAFGKRKLIVHLSPGKTWAGAVGAILGASLGSVAWFGWLGTRIDPQGHPGAMWAAVLFGLIIGVVGLAGDLCESLIKRDMGQKDSGELLPEFGGLLDLLDSVIYAAPVAYLLWIILPVWERIA